MHFFKSVNVNWVREALKGQQDVILEYWQLGRCLSGQRNAAQRWAEHFGAICAEHGFVYFQGGTIYRHRSGEAYLSVHVNDIILVASEEFCISFHERDQQEDEGQAGWTSWMWTRWCSLFKETVGIFGEWNRPVLQCKVHSKTCQDVACHRETGQVCSWTSWTTSLRLRNNQ
jgi:hypothetical protein